MKRMLAAGVMGACLVTAVPAQAAPGFKYTVCNFSDPSVPKPTKKYPYDFLLSASTAREGTAKVRRSVRSIQEVLRAGQIRDNSGNLVVVDGSYGPQTTQAVARFQQQAGITVDGKVGQQTWRKLGKKFCWMFH